MCPAATPDEFGDASWANAGVATITTKVSVSRSCFFMSVLYQPPLKNAIRKADNFPYPFLLLHSAPSVFAIYQLSDCWGAMTLHMLACPTLREKIVPHMRSSIIERTLPFAGRSFQC